MRIWAATINKARGIGSGYADWMGEIMPDFETSLPVEIGSGENLSAFEVATSEQIPRSSRQNGVVP